MIKLQLCKIYENFDFTSNEGIEIISQFARCSLCVLSRKGGEVLKFYGGVTIRNDKITLCYDCLRAELVGITFKISDIVNAQIVQNGVVLYLEDNSVINGSLETIYELPEDYRTLMNLSQDFFIQSPVDNKERILLLHKFCPLSEKYSPLKFQWLFKHWGAGVLCSTEDTPLTLCVKYIKGAGITIGIWNLRDNCYFKKPKYVVFEKELYNT